MKNTGRNYYRGKEKSRGVPEWRLVKRDKILHNWRVVLKFGRILRKKGG